MKVFTTMKPYLSEQAQKINQVIGDYQQKNNGKSPSIRDIGERVKLSPRRVHLYLIELERAGVIRRSPYKARNIEIINNTNSSLQKEEVILVPVVGMTSGGMPILADENIQDYIPVSRKLLGQDAHDCFLLKMKGNSMHPYLTEGDYAIVKKTQQPNENDIVLAAFSDAISNDYTSTVKKFRQVGPSQVVLQPINPDYKPIVVDLKNNNFEVQGKVIGAIKLDLAS